MFNLNFTATFMQKKTEEKAKIPLLSFIRTI